ncbi:hypothetical protein [Streptomyces violascens]|uniref:Uncharacterized protein n=2 Tax=Streptomyces violascens TaxID=67381 RepID=A0ABQ3QXI4_9ACTN|nr:hypothetical protein [Streptomyces violascens]GGU13238.1 hypothetical protein GCM10010289_38640 [Streptomyces violascens]GHI41914.1 hypothetical protein Sviol_63220 [Streptomyces violascens]
MTLVTCDPCTARYPDDVGACPNCGSTAQQGAGAAVPSVTVVCRTEYCPARGVERRLMLRAAAPGVLERPAPLCASCLLPMPELTEDHDMPKITVHGGPTVDTPTSAEGGEESSPGSSSSTSSEKASSSPKTSEPAAPLPVRKTASRSKKARTDASSAASTDGDQTEDTSESDDEDSK